MYKTFILAFFLISQINLNAQVFTISYFNAYESDIEAFENNQLNGFAVIAEQAIENNKLNGWYFFKNKNKIRFQQYLAHFSSDKPLEDLSSLLNKVTSGKYADWTKTVPTKNEPNKF